MGMFMSTLSNLTGLSYKYTNHCVHVTGTTNLTRANFSPNQIMSVTGHKSVNSLAMYQRVNGNEKLMMGMSLAYNLYYPAVVQQQMHSFTKAQREEIKYPHRQAVKAPVATPSPHQPNISAIATVNTAQAILPEEPTQNEVIPFENNKMDQVDFDILDFMNDNNDKDIVLAATQMEHEFACATTSSLVTATSTTKKTNPPKNYQLCPLSVAVRLVTFISISTST